MTQPERHSSSTRESYDRMAPIYDAFSAGNNYEVWLGEVLLPELRTHGLPRLGRALDVGCGTGRAFEPLLRRGWEVRGVDASLAMLERAKEKLPDPWGYRGRVELAQCDARELLPLMRPSKYGGPHHVKFDLILALNDVVNYLTEDGDLERAFEGMEKNLATEGLICFDANTLGLFEGDWTAGRNGSMAERGWSWSGLTAEVKPGVIFEAELSGEDVEAHVHRERHWSEDQVQEALDAAGLTCLARLGQREDGGKILLSESADEARDMKVIYIAGHSGE